jgi:hypothetical protein
MSGILGMVSEVFFRRIPTPLTATSDTVGSQAVATIHFFTANNNDYGWVAKDTDPPGGLGSLAYFRFVQRPLPSLHLRVNTVSESGSGFKSFLNLTEDVWVAQLAPDTLSAQSINVFTSGTDASYVATFDVDFSLDAGATIVQTVRVTLTANRTG